MSFQNPMIQNSDDPLIEIRRKQAQLREELNRLKGQERQILSEKGDKEGLALLDEKDLCQDCAKKRSGSISAFTRIEEEKKEMDEPTEVKRNRKQRALKREVGFEDSDDDGGKRKRKTKAQIKMLEQELYRNPHWSNEDVERISKKTGLKEG